MTRLSRLFVVLLALVMVASACSSTEDVGSASTEDDDGASTVSTETTVDEAEPSSESTSSPTTGDASDALAAMPVTAPIYDSLALGSPEETTASLIAAYDDRDFVRSWFMFDNEAHRVLNRALNNLDFGVFRRQTSVLPSNVIEGSTEHPFWNNIAMLARFFNDAAELGVLHVDFAGATVTGSEPFAGAGDNGDASSSIVTVALADGSDAQLWLTSTPTDRWRVRQVAIDEVDFEDTQEVFVDASCGRDRVRVYPGAECPSDEVGDWTINADVAAEVERLRAEAGDDIQKQIVNAQAIQDLVAGATSLSDYALCSALQGDTVVDAADQTEELLARAEALIESTCPGSAEFPTFPPDAPDSTDNVSDRTVYGRLDLSTPETAVITFGELFANEAFMMLYFTFDAEAQGAITRSINNLDVSTMVDPSVLETWSGVEAEEHNGSLIGNFASFMVEAGRTDGHLLDLSGPFEVTGTTALTWNDPRAGDVEAQVVEATSDALGGVYFLMVESPSGRWRVRQVAIDPAEFDSPDNDRAVVIAPR